MSLADLFSVPFLISLGITLILVGILGMFLSQRIMDQNHKISSMMGLVSTVVEELNYVRANIQMIASTQSFEKNNIQSGSGVEEKFSSDNFEPDSLISVSDDEDEEDEEEEEEDEEEEEEDEEDEEEEEIVVSETILLDESTIKVIDMGETMKINYTEDEEEEESAEEESEEEESEEEESIPEQQPVIKSNPVLKQDIKKMSIQSLKENAVRLGFTGDVSKVKKAELIKIVESLM